MKRRVIKTITFLLLLTGIYIVVAHVQYNPKTTFKCPEDYETEEKYLAATSKWIDEQIFIYPDRTVEEIFQERLMFLIEHECDETLKPYLSK